MLKIRETIFAAGLTGIVLFSSVAARAQEFYPTPEAAAGALIEAAKNPEKGMMDRIFGAGGSDLFSSGDDAVDKERLDDFLALAGTGSSVADGDGGEKRLVFGSNGWEFPVPLKQQDGKWRFDLAAGRQAIVDRNVGRNELLAIEACADYVDAQDEYFQTLHDDDPVQQYARRFISTEGLHDGLYWEPESATDLSPLGDQIAVAAVERGDDGEPGSYHGYRYRILTRQGPDAPGGAYDYLVKDRLLAGYAMLAYPAEWGTSGIMSFLCDQRGEVYQSNLGPDTAKLAPRILSFNPGPGWDPVAGE